MSPNSIIDMLKDAARNQQQPDGRVRQVLSLQDSADITQRSGRTRKEIDILALEHDIIPERYLRNLNILSPSDQVRLLQSRVCVVGLGGLGGTVTETLVRLGIGALTVVDGDCFDESNLNRQLLSSEHNLSQTKTASAVERILTINSATYVQDYNQLMGPDNVTHLLEQADIAVDCLDNIQARFVLEKGAQKAGIPMVSAAVAGFSGQVLTIFPHDRGLEQVYGPPATHSADKGAETTLGNLGCTVSLVASLECAEVVKILLEKETNLRNQLLIIDLSDYTFEKIQLT
jgi:molybdopterin/thiamine biosynthesis adenylyltransferase